MALLQTLDNLQAFQTYWCWLAHEPQDTPLVLLDTREANAIDRFADQVFQQEPGVGRKGLASVSADGRLSMMIIDAIPASLNVLAKYAQQHNVTALQHARVVGLNEDGRVVAIHEDQALWSSPLYEIASPQHAAHILQHCKPGQSMWFGFSANQQRGDLLLSPQHNDPQANGFVYSMEQIGNRYEQEPHAVRGVLRKNQTGSYTLTTTTEEDDWTKPLFSWLKKQPCLASLTDLRIAKVQDKKINSFQLLQRLVPKGKIPLSTALSPLLESLPAEKSLFFVFTKRGGLTVGRSKEELLETSKIPSNEVIRGRLKKSAKGYFIFQLRQDAKGVLKKLYRWWRSVDGKTVLPMLTGARVVQLDSSKNIVFREKNDAIWSS